MDKEKGEVFLTTSWAELKKRAKEKKLRGKRYDISNSGSTQLGSLSHTMGVDADRNPKPQFFFFSWWKGEENNRFLSFG